MTDRENEKMINALRDMADYFRVCRKHAASTGTAARRFEIYVEAAEDVAELLKAPREPRVMTLKEIDDDDAYWFEEKYGKKSLGRNVLIHSIEEDAREPYITLVYTYGEASYKISEYGQAWRLWTSKPTDEQQEATPWEKG